MGRPKLELLGSNGVHTQNHQGIAYWLTQPVGRIQFTDTPTEVSWTLNHIGDAAIRERKLTHSQSYFSIEKIEVMQSRQ